LLAKLKSGSAELSAPTHSRSITLLTNTTPSEQAESTFQSAFLPFLAGCLARVGVRPPNPRLPFPISDPAPDDQPLFAKSAALISESKTLLKEYTELAELRVDTSARDKLLATLEREEKELSEAVEAGRRVAHTDVSALLGSRFDDSESGEIENPLVGRNVLGAGAQEAQAKARTRGEFTDRAMQTEKWGAVAKETVKAFGKMSRVAERSTVVE
jgi:hypothetical protein